MISYFTLRRGEVNGERETKMFIELKTCIATGQEMAENYLTRTTDNKFVRKDLYEQAMLARRKGLLHSNEILDHLALSDELNNAVNALCRCIRRECQKDGSDPLKAIKVFIEGEEEYATTVHFKARTFLNPLERLGYIYKKTETDTCKELDNEGGWVREEVKKIYTKGCSHLFK